MYKHLYILTIFFILFSCGKNVVHDDLKYLNGYWEITEVNFPTGVKKEYTINETIDFFQWEDTIGTRKKVKPQLDGTFFVTNDEEKIKLLIHSGQFVLNYQTPFDQWQEKILKLTDEELILQNEQQVQYHYKRFQSLNLE